MKYLFMHPPRWLEKVLVRSERYRAWYIKQVCHVLHDDVIKSIKDDFAGDI